MKSPPTIRKAVSYVGDDLMGRLRDNVCPVATLFDWFHASKYGMSRFSVGMLTALFPAMHFSGHLALRLESSRAEGRDLRCRFYMRPRTHMLLPDYMAYIEAEYPAMHARIRCGVSTLRSACMYYQFPEWQFKALLRLFYDYVYGTPPLADEIEITPTAIFFNREGRQITLYQDGEFGQNFDWSTVIEE